MLLLPIVSVFLTAAFSSFSFLTSQGAFASAIQRSGYPASYRGVFPVKCNHDRDVVRAVVEFGLPYNFGLEVGSKAELVLAAATLAESGSSSVGTLIICNGYKDAEYMELAMRVGQLGPSVVIVMEQPEEVALAIKAATGVPGSPTALGIRAKLGTVHAGHWASTSGDAAKFGLNTRQIVAAVHRLGSTNLLSRLQLLHFHVGSQMSSLGEVRDALAEGAALYAELVKMGAHGLSFLDVGGGLAIDYDGSGSEEHTSRAYALEDYASAVVNAVGEACASRDVVPPTLVSESGRALASHHAVVVFDVIQKTFEDAGEAAAVGTPSHSIEDNGDSFQEATSGSAKSVSFSPTTASLHSPLLRCSLAEQRQSNNISMHKLSPKANFLLSTLRQLLDSMGPTSVSLRGALRDAAYFKEDTLRAFKLGMLTLPDKAAVDELVDAIATRSRELATLHNVNLNTENNSSGSSSNSSDPPVSMVHINLSVFRSAVDCWAIDQVFPIMPLSKLDQPPDMRAVLADLTCDSDGKIDSFINPNGGAPLCSLPLHCSTNSNEPYRLGMFLTGVYQETMGSNHNMFGSLNSATIRVRPISTTTSTGTSGGGGQLQYEIVQVNAVENSEEDELNNNNNNGVVQCSTKPVHPVASCMSLCSEGGVHGGGGSGGGGSECSSQLNDAQNWNNIDRNVAAFKSSTHGFVIERTVAGESVATVLSRAGHDADLMLRSMHSMATEAVAGRRVDVSEAQAAMQCVASRLDGYTYMR
jgi:arginine decarboxylase